MDSIQCSQHTTYYPHLYTKNHLCRNLSGSQKKPIRIMQKPIRIMQKPIRTLQKSIRIMQKPIRIMQKPVETCRKSCRDLDNQGQVCVDKIRAKPMETNGAEQSLADLSTAYHTYPQPSKVINRVERNICNLSTDLSTALKTLSEPLHCTCKPAHPNAQGRLTTHPIEPQKTPAAIILEATSLCTTPRFSPDNL